MTDPNPPAASESMPDGKSPARVSLPRQIGKYSVIGVAGEGNMGVVYVGHDPLRDQDVAIKVCPVTSGSGFELARKLFFNEAHAAGSLDHPNILAILDAGEQDGVPYIVTEYVEGAGTLRAHVSPDTLLPLPRVLQLLHQCAKALDYAHRRGVVHRDIKPSNIMLTRDGMVKVGDFGIAQHALSTDTIVTSVFGSPRYMSPEQVEERELNHQTDIFSLGVVAYELVTGHPPFVARTIMQLAKKILHEEPTSVDRIRPETPVSVARIISKAMAKTCEDRYPYAHEMAADLASVFGQMGYVRSEPGPAQRFAAARALSFFNDFSDEELHEVLSSATWHEANAGATIIAERAEGRAFYVLASGEATVQIGGQAVGTVASGDCFGEMAMIGQRTRGASVLATEACTLLRIEDHMLERASTGCQLRFNREFVRRLGERLTLTNARLARSLAS